MHYEPVFYPDYFELWVALGLIIGSFSILYFLWSLNDLMTDYERLKKLSRFDLYIELTRCFSAMMTCASRDNDNGTHYASRRVWLISRLLRKGEYTQYEKMLAEAYFENYLALFRSVDRSWDIVANEKQWHDRWSRKSLAADPGTEPERYERRAYRREGQSRYGKSSRQPQERIYTRFAGRA